MQAVIGSFILFFMLCEWFEGCRDWFTKRKEVLVSCKEEPSDGSYTAEYNEPTDEESHAIRCTKELNLHFEKKSDGWRIAGDGLTDDGILFQISDGFVDQTGRASWTENIDSGASVKCEGTFDFRYHTFSGEWRTDDGKCVKYLSFQHKTGIPADGPYIAEYMEPPQPGIPEFKCNQVSNLRFKRNENGWKIEGSVRDADGVFEISDGFVDENGNASWTETGNRNLTVYTTGTFDLRNYTFSGQWKASNGRSGEYLIFKHQTLAIDREEIQSGNDGVNEYNVDTGLLP